MQQRHKNILPSSQVVAVITIQPPLPKSYYVMNKAARINESHNKYLESNIKKISNLSLKIIFLLLKKVLL